MLFLFKRSLYFSPTILLFLPDPAAKQKANIPLAFIQFKASSSAVLNSFSSSLL